jgi:23S rRNA-/tRNA-specific pseudouridylate synthase
VHYLLVHGRVCCASPMRTGGCRLHPLAAEALPGGAHPAHRLDQLTGGVMLFVKTRPAAAALARQFEAR